MTHGKKTHVCKLKKALDGLKHAPRVRYVRMDGLLHNLGFSKSIAKSSLCFEVVHNHVLILVIYIDDLFLIGDEHLIENCKRELTSEVEMKYLELVHYFLGLEVWKKLGDIFLTQRKYAVDIL